MLNEEIKVPSFASQIEISAEQKSALENELVAMLRFGNACEKPFQDKRVPRLVEILSARF